METKTETPAPQQLQDSREVQAFNVMVEAAREFKGNAQQHDVLREACLIVRKLVLDEVERQKSQSQVAEAVAAVEVTPPKA